MDEDLKTQLAQLEPAVRLALDKLNTAIAKESVIQDYQKIEAQVQQNQHLQQVQADLKKAQREIVTYKRIDKTKAAQVATENADRLKQTLEQDPLTLAYRQSLMDANDILTYITGQFETKLAAIMAKEDH
ncbi:hypothetical protein FC83_GL000349 [Agrilactobacillus composti DSM 18527 = JCM 14202]|uniref:Cell fate regulator YmcA, YheA/YmcA/DUF963 family (Controls sporulation, competence, biofilm development) n=1 Tax=Agrilactobacillus composti DSM 18527 = JCM 14202 TaxID=1423734 RepID=X0PEC0_9LACO|nr:YlbF family regulator [Agrilactobacillus composti]KRM32484.1 hypothetical protein FC83_GL000349 [Agrilactobacillus composti DSM 18527 = JCM 14202]GAF39919.1 hypothetical protein JCM14202_1798 [Agrilactobacillus composti DSM 18527 = JCM 14202]